MVSYERLWKTMEKKGISQYRLINHYKISAGQIGRMKKNMHGFHPYPGGILQYFTVSCGGYCRGDPGSPGTRRKGTVQCRRQGGWKDRSRGQGCRKSGGRHRR